MITVWNLTPSDLKPYERKCRNRVLLDLFNRDIDTDLIIAFGLKYKSEDADMLLIGPTRFVIGELKHSRDTFKGGKNGNWTTVTSSGRPKAWCRDKSPLHQCMVQQKNLGKVLKKYADDIFIKTKKNQTVPFPQAFQSIPDWCFSGLVQYPKLKVDLKPINDKWWYAEGFDNWLSKALEMSNAESNFRINLDRVNEWLDTMVYNSRFELEEACVKLGLISGSEEIVESEPEPEPEGKSFSEEQVEALEATFEKPLLILAGAGAGKTHVLTERVNRLFGQLKSDKDWMAVITYTNAAKNELESRLNLSNKNCFIGTVHQLAKFLLEKDLKSDSRIQILDKEQSIRKLSQLAEINYKSSRLIVNSISDGKELSKDQMGKYKLFLEYMSKFNMATFDSLLSFALQKSESGKLVVPKYIVIDEYQDSKPNQIELFLSLSSQGSVLNVVGDPEQAIFQSPEQILSFQDQFPSSNLKKLNNNYRSDARIVELGNELRSANDPLGPQRWASDITGGVIHCERFRSNRDQNEWLLSWINDLIETNHPLGTIAILFKENASGRRVARLFERNGIPYTYTKKEYTKLPLTMRLVALLRYIQDSQNVQNLSMLFDHWPGMSDVLGSKLIKAFQEASDLGKDKCLSESVISKLEGNLASDNMLSLEWSEFKKVIDHAQSLSESSIPVLLQKLLDEILLPSVEYGFKDQERVLGLLVFALSHKADHDEAFNIEAIIKAIQFGEVEIDSGSDSPNAVVLSTIHKAKGLQWESVAVVDVKDGIFPFSRFEKSESDIELEQRCFHVAVTRTKQNLAICCPKKVLGRSGRTSGSTYGDLVDDFLSENTFQD